MADWSEPYNFGALGGLPKDWSVRYCEIDEMWYAVRGDNPDDGNTGVQFCSPWKARKHAIAVARAAVSSAERPDAG